MNNHRHTMPVTKYNGGSYIPLRKQLSRQNSNSSTSSGKLSSDPTHRWKQKYDESEEKRRILLSEKEKALRNLNELEKKHLNLQVEHEKLETQLFEKDEELTRLTTASKNLYKEYDTLKNQYETETGAMARALKDATQWYKENKALKRKTLLLTDKDTVDEGVDAGESASDADIDNLNKTIKQLSTEVAELQTELDSVKQSEFQTLEQNVKLSEDLDFAKIENKKLKNELDELLNEHKQLLRVSEMMKKELGELKEIEVNQRNDIIALRKEAGEQKRERNVLAHQSTLLLQGLNDGTESLILLQEIENLKRTIEDERNRYEEEINSLHERLEDQDTNSHVEILEERLKLAEAELLEAIKRAEEAESKLKAPPLPPPPPPPPPLPLLISDQPPTVPLRRRRSRATVEDLAKTIGVQESTPEKKPAAPGVNEDIINAIKEGKFTLKKSKKANGSKDKETPKAVSEILNILGSLRRAPKKRQSQYNADVQL